MKDAQWVHNPIDHFILAKLEAAGLNPLRKPISIRSSGG